MARSSLRATKTGADGAVALQPVREGTGQRASELPAVAPGRRSPDRGKAAPVRLHGGNHVFHRVFHQHPLLFRQAEEFVRQIVDFLEHAAFFRPPLDGPIESRVGTRQSRGGRSKLFLDKGGQRIRRRTRPLRLGQVVRYRKRQAQELRLLHLRTLCAKRRRAVEREPQHQPAVEQSRKQHAAAFVSRRYRYGLDDVLESQRILDPSRAQPLSFNTGAVDAPRHENARSIEPRFETFPAHGTVLPRFQSVTRPRHDLKLLYRQVGCRDDDVAVLAFAGGAPRPLGVGWLKALSDAPSSPASIPSCVRASRIRPRGRRDVETASDN